MRVGVIGPSDLVQLCVEVGREHHGVQFIALPYTHETEALPLFTENRSSLDVFLFTGVWGYRQVIQHYGSDQLGMPLVRLSANFGSIIYKLLSKMLASGINPGEISIDGLSKQEVADIYAEVGLDPSGVYTLTDKERPIPREVLTSFHLNLWRQGKTRAALTYVRSVYESLMTEGMPAFRGMPELATIRAGVARAALEAQAVRAEERQIVVGLISIDQTRRAYRSHYDSQRIRSRVYQEILEFGEEMGASVVPSEAESWALFTTRGALTGVTKNYSFMPLLKRVNENVSAAVSVGFGIAPSAYQSQMNAESALHMCREQGGNTCYVVYHDGRAVGPLGYGANHECRAKPCQNPKHSRIASLAGLSVATVSRIASLVDMLGTNKITASQLATELGIADRNGRRILMHLVDAGAATVSGLELPEAKGRPRKVYVLNI